MKTKDLIQRLQEADPTGELEVTVGKTDIYFLQVLPGYYDGCHEILMRDPAGEGRYYNITGAEIRSEGQHVCIETHSIRDAMLDNPEFPVTFQSEYAEKHYSKHVQRWREEMRRINEEVDREMAAKEPPTERA